MMPRLVRAVAAAAALAAISAQGGCAPRQSKLETGQSVTTGKKKFDALFEGVASLRDHVGDLDSDAVREPLVDAVGAKKDVGFTELMATTNERARRLRDYGLTMSLLLTPTPKLVSVRGDLALDPKDESFLAAVDKASGKAMERYRDDSALLDRSMELRGELPELGAAAESLPADDSDRNTLKVELAGAERILDESDRKLQKDVRSVARFLLELSVAVDTGAQAAREARCEEALAGVKKPGKTPTGPRGPLPPPPPKKPGGDFEM